MQSSEAYDIVVLGAGVAGLLIAGELAQRHRVLVLERSESLHCPKYWLTDRASAAANADLETAIDTSYSTMDFIAYDGLTFRATGDYVLWESSRLIDHLANRIKKAGGEIDLGQQFYSIRENRDAIVVMANSRSIRARLVIDCMGYQSPIVFARNVMSVMGYYLLYGATFPLRAAVAPVALHNLMLSDHPGYIEAFPTEDGRLHIVLIVPAAELKPLSSLQSDFTFIVSKSPYAKHIDSPVSPERRFLGGIVPVGRMRRAALDRIFFFGEAGQSNPAASATALTRMLQSYRGISKHLSDCLAADSVSARDLGAVKQPVGGTNQRLQRALFRSILHWRSDDFRTVIDELVRLDDTELVNHLVFGDLSEAPGDVLCLVVKLASARSRFIGGSLLRSLLPI